MTTTLSVPTPVATSLLSAASVSSIFAMVSLPADTTFSLTTPAPSATSLNTPFNPVAQTNLAVYFGHTPGNFNASLPALCNISAVDIVILGFVRAFNGYGHLPTFDLRKDCTNLKNTSAFDPPASSSNSASLSPSTTLGVAASRVRPEPVGASSGVPAAPLIKSPPLCPQLAQDVWNCQMAGKKVFVSTGGSTSDTGFSTSNASIDAAYTMWNSFGPGIASPSLRPLGPVIVDGFDVDHEQDPTTYYDIFASTLRNLISTNKDYCTYLSAAPLCANTTALMPSNFYSYIDFLWPRFYNARACNTGSKGFLTSFKAWLDFQTSVSRTQGQIFLPRIFVGALSFDSSAFGSGTGYVNASVLGSLLGQARSIAQDKFGGAMLWDGTEGLMTSGTNDGSSYLAATKAALESNADALHATFMYHVYYTLRRVFGYSGTKK